MTRTIEQFLGDGDGPACDGAPEAARGPLLIMTRQVTANWRVSREGELVVIQIGNLPPLRIKAAGAALFGQAIMVKAHEAKMLSGEKRG